MKNVIYIIRNKINSRVYIGSAVKFNVRKNQHTHHLKKGSHHNRPLQNFVNKYALDKISFEILDSDCKKLINREQYYMDKLNPYFNISKVAASNQLGLKRTNEQIQNMINGRLSKSGYKKGYKRSKDICEKVGAAHRGKKISKEQKLMLSKLHKGKTVSEDVRFRISKTMKGMVFSEEHKEKLSKSALGNTNWKGIDYLCKDRNEKISKAMKKRMSKLVLNTKTGIYYDSAKQAADSIGMPRGTFTKHLSGFNKVNKTDFIYAD